MRRSVAVLACAFALTLGACGGGSDEPADTATSSGSGASADDAGDTKVLDVCGEISAEEVGDVIGGTVTSEVGPFDTCEYDQEDPRATSVAIDAQSLAELGGGYEAYKAGSAGVLTDGETVDLDGIGDQAFITTGRFGDGENTQLQGAVVVGGQLVSVNLTQAQGLEGSVLVDQATKLLELVVAKA